MIVPFFFLQIRKRFTFFSKSVESNSRQGIFGESALIGESNSSTEFFDTNKEAKVLLAKEAYERQVAELNALKESTGKKEFVDALFSCDNRYRRYSRKEIEIATNFFSETNVIGEGGYGKVYKCSLDQTPVAVKVLRPDAVEKKEEFLKEVEILSQLPMLGGSSGKELVPLKQGLEFEPCEWSSQYWECFPPKWGPTRLERN
ncbi:putative protein kinase RLK-Pelle-RLCK-IXb family [Rosa chinensis]|uniref:RING-type E3 ubiquitin transferase n=1 Tax=Rosa chinensis TaxID=74649 RepID=A0A2P6PFY7_ROSCH|nr:putative protein kinase RLK-Pelle-RLCK-IXb family [Rosa chinensis]